MSLPASEVSSRVIRPFVQVYVGNMCIIRVCCVRFAPDRDRKEHLLGAMKTTIVLASVVGVYALTMALTQPLSRLGKKDQ